MEELDGLQLELELLLSSVLVRQMAVNTQLTIIHQLEKGKIISKPVSFVWDENTTFMKFKLSFNKNID